MEYGRNKGMAMHTLTEETGNGTLTDGIFSCLQRYAGIFCNHFRYVSVAQHLLKRVLEQVVRTHLREIHILPFRMRAEYVANSGAKSRQDYA